MTTEDDRTGSEVGAAVAEFVMVSALLCFVFLGIVQVAVVLHVRNILVASAAEGARAGANAGVDPGTAGPVTTELVRRGLSDRAAQTFVPDVSTTDADGVPVVEVTLTGEIPLFFVPLGPGVPVTVHARAVREVP